MSQQLVLVGFQRTFERGLTFERGTLFQPSTISFPNVLVLHSSGIFVALEPLYTLGPEMSSLKLHQSTISQKEA